MPRHGSILRPCTISASCKDGCPKVKDLKNQNFLVDLPCESFLDEARKSVLQQMRQKLHNLFSRFETKM